MAVEGFEKARDTETPILSLSRRSDWVRMRTLTTLRWIAIAGQVTGVLVGQMVFDLHLHLGLIHLTIGAAMLTNVMAAFVYPRNKRLTETELVATLIFDMLQLSILLFLTGGLHNPFALLVLAQVAIAATALSRRPTILVCAVAIVAITVLWTWHMPLVTDAGEVLRQPDLFVAGFWCAIVVGVVFQAAYARRVTSEVTAMADALTATQMALSREQKLTDLGGVVAAAAHELGTPLATIALVSTEMASETDDPEMREDAQLIREQAERCRLILRAMGQAGKSDPHLQRAPVSSVLEEAAGPHADRGIDILYDLSPEGSGPFRQPIIARRPEIVHGVRNLVQNAVDFAQSRVTVVARWNHSELILRIGDDGPGFPSELLPKLGDPFLRRGARRRRGGDEGMGLGLFIAKTLLERSGAEVTFANRPGAEGGAIVTLAWPLAILGDTAAPAMAPAPDGPDAVGDTA